MQTRVDPAAPTPTEVLIPEARRRQRRRYVRSAIITVLCAFVVAALISAAVVVFTGPPAGGKARSGQIAEAAGGTGLVFFRPVLCFAVPYNPALYTAAAAQSPSCSGNSALTPSHLSVEPNDTPGGYSINNVAPDPALAAIPSTRSSAEKASSRVLLPALHENMRYLLGAAEMTSASIRSATATRTQTGQWVVNYTMAGSANWVLWDKVAHENFHQLLGIDFDGVVVSAPIIQPTQSVFSSFKGQGEVSGNLSRSDAIKLTQAMNKDH